MLTIDERIELVEKAQRKLQKAIMLLRKAFPDDGYVQAYMIAHLQIMASANHGYLSRETNLDDLIQQLKESDGTPDEE